MSFHYRNFTLDESEGLPYKEWEENERINKMFNAFHIYNHDFTVSFVKADGTIRTMTGNLFGPDKGAALTEDELESHLVKLQEDHLVPVFTDQGWRSFDKNRMIAITTKGKDTL
jgi:hypothetical protein